MKLRCLIGKFGIVLLVISLMTVVACTKHHEVSTSPEEEAAVNAEEINETGEKGQEKGITQEDLAARERRERAEAEAEKQRLQAERERAAKAEFINENIYFDFDKSSLTRKAQGKLSQKVKWLRDHSNVDVVIGGHTDERGTKEYNMTLGQRRAQSIKNFLVDAGIDPARLEAISYGEEQPAVPRHNESAWAKNRRGHFRLK